MTINISGSIQLTGGPSSIALSDLSDVSIVSPQDGQYLRYNGGINEWQNAYINSDVYNFLNTNLTSSNGVNLSFTPGPNTIDVSLSLTASGDAAGTVISGNLPLTLATVNSNVGTFGSSTQIPVITVNAKGLITGVTTSSVTASSSTNIAGGSTGEIPYQTSTNNTSFITAGTSSQLLIGGTTPSWTSSISGLSSVSSTTFVGALTGNSSTASALLTTRSITASGDADWTVNFNGSANVSSSITLVTVNSSIGQFCVVTVNAKGLVTSATNLSGDASTSGAVITLATVNSSPQSDTFRKVTINGKGLVTATTAVSAGDITSSLGYTPVNVTGDTMSGYLILNADPVTALGAVTKQYADNIASGISIHAACITATTTALPASTYNNGASGVGATLTANSNGAIGTVGGYASLIVTDRVLVKDQSSQLQNGIYDVTDLGSAGTPWILTRSADFDGSPASEIGPGDLTFVQSGTLGGIQWVQLTPDPITVGSTAIVFSQFSGSATYVAGSGIDITGVTISNTGVLSNIAGTGINVSGATGNVTVTNTGVTSLTLTQPSAGITLTNSGVAQTLGATSTFALSDDLLGVESLSTTGLAVRTASNTWTTRSVLGTTNRILSTNPDGVSGDITLDISSSYVGQSSLTTLGTITTGIWNGTTIAVANGGTGLTSTPANGQIDIGNGTGFTRTTLTAGTGVTINNTSGAITINATGTGGTVTSVSVASANGFAGSVATSTTTPAITLSTTITGILSGNGTAISAASTTGTGSVVLNTSPALITPALGTPSSGVLTNCTGLPNSGLVNSSITIGSTPISLGGTSATLAGLTSVTSTTFVGSVTGAASLNVLKSGDTMAGSLTSPAFIPSGSTVPTNGLYLPAASSVGIATAGVENLRVNSTGQVLIGTANTTSGSTTKLVVSGNVTAFSGTVPTTTVAHIIGSDTSSARIVIDSIGANSVFQGRRANGTLASPSIVQVNEPIVSFGGNGYDGSWLSAFAGGMFLLASENFTPTAHGCYFAWNTSATGTVSSTEKMRLTSIGQLGIGTSAPVATLHVSSNTSGSSVAVANSVAHFVGADAGSCPVVLDSFGSIPVVTGRRAGGTAAAKTAVSVDNNLFIIDGRGYGTTTYSAGVVAIRMLSAETFTDSAQGTYMTFWTTPIGSTATTERMRIDSSGNLLLGTTSAVASERLLVSHTGSNFNAVVIGDRATPTNDTGILLRTNGNAKIETSNAPLIFALGGADRFGMTIGAFSPGTNNVQSLGTSALNWSNTYTKAVSDGTDELISSGGTTVRLGAGSSWTIVSLYANGSARSNQTNTSFRPASSGTYSMGESSLRWSNVYSVSGDFSSNISASAFIPLGSSVPTNGLYLPAANSVGIATNSTERMHIDSSGNVGIGTASSGDKLEVAGNAKFSGGGTLRRSAAFSNTGGICYVGVESSSGGAIFAGTSPYAGILGTDNSTPLQFATSSTVRMTIDSAGKVFIGGSTAGIRQLNVNNATNVEMVLKSTSASGVTGTATYYFGNSSTDSAGFISYDIAANSMLFGTLAASKLIIDSTGNITPVTNNALTSGSSSLRWANTYSVLGNFSGTITNTQTGTGYQQSTSNSGGNNLIILENTSNTAASNAKLVVQVGGTSSGDPAVVFNNSGAGIWSIGQDTSDSGAFVFAASNTLGTSNVLRISTAGAIDIGGTISSSKVGNGFNLISSNSGGINEIFIQNTSNTANSATDLFLQVAGSSAGDTYITYQISGIQTWTTGVDNSDSDAYVIAASATLGSSNVLRISTAGAITVGGTITNTQTGTGYSQSSSNNGGNNAVTIINTSNTASSSSLLGIYVAGASAADPYTYYEISGVQGWSTGIDNSDSDAYVIAASGTLGSSNVLRISTAGAVTMPGTLGVTGAITASGGVVGNLTGNASTASNSTLLTGLSPSTSATANTIVQRDGNGYIFGVYLNATDEGTSGTAGTVTSIITKRGDAYYRSTSAQSVATYLSGSSMNIGGNATTATTASALTTGNSYQVGSLGVGTAASGTTGEIRATNNITAYYSSDVRLKENIVVLDSALDKINSIRGVSFDWTDDYIKSHGGEDGYFVRKKDVGVIAQEIESVLPEAVADREDGYKGVQYEKLVPLLIEAVKELTEKIRILENRK